jgi:hypothetical protein
MWGYSLRAHWILPSKADSIMLIPTGHLGRTTRVNVMCVKTYGATHCPIQQYTARCYQLVRIPSELVQGAEWIMI